MAAEDAGLLRGGPRSHESFQNPEGKRGCGPAKRLPTRKPLDLSMGRCERMNGRKLLQGVPDSSSAYCGRDSARQRGTPTRTGGPRGLQAIRCFSMASLLPGIALEALAGLAKKARASCSGTPACAANGRDQDRRTGGAGAAARRHPADTKR